MILQNTPKPQVSGFNIWVVTLVLFMVIGAVAGIMVFFQGLVVTNLTDTVPWGLWITIDLSAIALSAGAFLFCAAVYILKLEQFQPMARTATYIGLIGYSMAMLCLLLDIGRPDRFWHGFVYWNTHSVLWEVTMCVGLYFSVLSLETLPIIGQADWFQKRWPKLSQPMQDAHKLAPGLAIAGLCLSLLHQSSLGATYGVLLARPIWYRPGLAILFITSAAAGGLALTTLASSLSAKLTPLAVIDKRRIEQVAKVIGWILLGYLYLRFWDIFTMHYTYQPGKAEGLELLLSGPLAFNFWIGEILLGIVIPAFVLLNGRLRKQNLLRILALLLIVGGVVAYRWDTNLVGQLIVQSLAPFDGTTVYTSYRPSLVEFAAGAGIISFGLLTFTLGVKFLGIVDHHKVAHSVAHLASAD